MITINLVSLVQLILAMAVGSFLGLMACKVIEDTSIWCLIQSHPNAIVVYYKGKLVKNQLVIAAIKTLRSLVLKFAK